MSMRDGKPPEQTTPKRGQIWREVDPRFTRYAKVIDFARFKSGDRIQLRSVSKSPAGWETVPHSRPTWCDLKRFNGRRGGYELHEDVP
jgi:hypothetical protein